MDANTMPRSSAVSFPYDAKSYRIRNLRNLAVWVAPSRGTPPPSVAAPDPRVPLPSGAEAAEWRRKPWGRSPRAHARA
jgi:hypothetical protein